MAHRKVADALLGKPDPICTNEERQDAAYYIFRVQCWCLAPICKVPFNLEKHQPSGGRTARLDEVAEWLALPLVT
ncbi:hypothetical protein D3C87_1654080 [compost metagenome]